MLCVTTELRGLRGLRDGKHQIRVPQWANHTGFFRTEGADAVESGTRGLVLRATR